VRKRLRAIRVSLEVWGANSISITPYEVRVAAVQTQGGVDNVVSPPHGHAGMAIRNLMSGP
jgi:hypothetical protein